MKKRIIAGALNLMLILSAMLSLTGCSTTVQAADLMAGVTANNVNTDINFDGDESEVIADFAVELFQHSMSEDENVLISPVSVLCALAMTANGSAGETRAQMEKVLGLSTDELNVYLHAYMESLPSDDKCKISLANSIWFKDDEKLTVKKDFLQTNADYYGASVYKAAFDDATLKDINNWVADKTDGMIENILNKIPDEAVMYLINAVAFDAKWQNIYKENQIQDGIFTTESGKIRDTKMMYSQENKYLDDGNATGFIKYYVGQKYAFAALLPNEGTSITDYVSSLTGSGLKSTLAQAQTVSVNTAIPKFESDYSVEMSDILKSMGMTDAFDGDLADFTKLGTSQDGNIFINRVLHKTFIAVDESGTRAGAATVVEMTDTTAIEEEEPKTVYLDRPFVYMLIDCETNLPIFIGTVSDMEK